MDIDSNIDPFKEGHPSNSPLPTSPPPPASPSLSLDSHRIQSSPIPNTSSPLLATYSASVASPSHSVETPKPILISPITTPGRGGRPTLRDLKDVEEIQVDLIISSLEKRKKVSVMI